MSSWAFQPVVPAAAQLLSGPSTVGFIKVWDGSQWVKKPVKYWTGAEWVTKPLKYYKNGQWNLTT